MNHPDWLYFLVYPGSLEGMDSLIREVIPPAVDFARRTEAIDRWFFLRNIDENGIHLRLRLRGTFASVGPLQVTVEDLIRAALASEASRPRVPMDRLVPLRFDPSGYSTYTGYKLGIYEPELDKFGGEVGVDIAERCFQAASELTLEALCQEPLDMSSRALLALLLMAAAVNEAIPHSERDKFWDYYSWYWTGGEHAGATSYRAGLVAAAQKRAAWVGRRCLEYLAEPDVRQRVEAYRHAIGTAIRSAKEAGVEPDPSALCFQYVHLTNNRLGILPAEEGYLAHLVQSVTVPGELFPPS